MFLRKKLFSVAVICEAENKELNSFTLAIRTNFPNRSARICVDNSRSSHLQHHDLQQVSLFLSLLNI